MNRRHPIFESMLLSGVALLMRLRHAQLLYDTGDLTEARRELRIIVRQEPGHAQAGRLLEQIVSELVRGSSEKQNP